MAIRIMEIPECDVCGELTLPQKGPGRDNPRENHKRCGKCKNPRWDWKWKAQQEAALSSLSAQPAKTESTAEKTISKIAKPSNAPIAPVAQTPDRSKSRGTVPCKHRKLNCPICHKK